MNDFQIIKISSEWQKELDGLFHDVSTSGDDKLFHPHGYTSKDAYELANYNGKDLYFIAVRDRRILGYGMLRGWDEGYEDPFLGVYLRPEARGTGLSQVFMSFMHFAAKCRGSSVVKLKVYKSNTKAVELYKSLGYHMSDYDANQILGVLDI